MGGLFNGYFFKPFTNSLEALKAGTLQGGMMTVVFFEMLRAVFSALFFTMKLPKPLRYTFSSFDNESFTISIKASTVDSTDVFIYSCTFADLIYNICFCHKGVIIFLSKTGAKVIYLFYLSLLVIR